MLSSDCHYEMHDVRMGAMVVCLRDRYLAFSSVCTASKTYAGKTSTSRKMNVCLRVIQQEPATTFGTGTMIR